MRNIFLFLGPPGSGKGTQSDTLAAKLGWPVISSGELLRQEKHEGSYLGKKAARYMNKGELVPDKIIHEIIAKKLSLIETDGIIFDGYPRDIDQLKDLLTLVEPGDELHFIYIDIAPQEVVNRLSGRRVCDCGASYHLVYKPPKTPGICDLCGEELYIREDDRPEVVEERLSRHKKLSLPILDYARKADKLIEIDGSKSIGQVEDDIMNAVSEIIKVR